MQEISSPAISCSENGDAGPALFSGPRLGRHLAGSDMGPDAFPGVTFRGHQADAQLFVIAIAVGKKAVVSDGRALLRGAVVESIGELIDIALFRDHQISMIARAVEFDSLHVVAARWIGPGGEG